jgi:membrane protease YdiL (CAAX protease family)
MKTIVGYLRDYVREEWHGAYFGAVFAFLGILFFINYQFRIERSILQTLSYPFGQAGFYFIFYFIPYIAVHLLRAVFTRRSTNLASVEFWLVSVFGFVVLALYVAIHNGPAYLLRTQPELFAPIPLTLQPIAARCASNALPPLVMGLPLVAFWWWRDKESMPLYGFSAKSIDLRPYVVILLLLVPLVVGASFTGDFQNAYPRFKFGFPDSLAPVSRAGTIGAFEFCYGIDFVFIEFFFRGFLILAFARILGPRAILPMVVVYAMIHFEKPLLEAVSSIVGGFVLGVISYRTKSIYGGVILHLGIAWMMELAGSFHLPS